MSRRSRPWQLFVILLLLVAAAIGYMEYMRRQEIAALKQLDAQVADATQKKNQLQARETELDKDRPAREDLQAHLMDPNAGTYYRQLLMTVVAASRQSGATLEGGFALGSDGGFQGVATGVVAGGVRGSEEQIRAFFRILEEGKPIAQFDQVGWLVRTTRTSNETGDATVNMRLFGPVAP